MTLLVELRFIRIGGARHFGDTGNTRFRATGVIEQHAVANLHFMASLTHAHYPAEYNDKSGRQNAVFRQPIAPKDGFFTLSNAPGLGLELNEAEFNRRMVRWAPL